MENKIYTAQEMRDMAECISHIKQSEMPSWKEGEIITGGDLCRSAEMLRQAAEVVERCKIVMAEADIIRSMPKAPLDGFCSHQNVNAEIVLAKIAFFDMVSATLRGDTGREDIGGK